MDNNPALSPQVNPVSPAVKVGIPALVKILSILYYIGSVISVFAGLALILGGGLISSMFSSIPLLSTLGSGLFVVAGIIIIAFGLLYFFIGRGLWKGQKWSRVIVIIFECIAVLGSIFSITTSVIWGTILAVINGLIGGYLLFSKNVKQAFS